jgi:hypothetical protein
MKTKICSKCKIDKDTCEFYNEKNKKNGLSTYCKLCTINKTKEYYKNNRDIILENTKEYRSKYNKEYYLKNKIKESIRNKNYRDTNPEKVKESSNKWKRNNPDKYKLSHQKSKQKNKEKFKKNNIHIIAWRTLLNNSLKRFNTKKENKTIELLGYSAYNLKEHLESKFLEGMSWDNRNEWHIDHIKPISSFDKNEKMSVVNSLENLQPLWAKDNLSKGSKII